MDNRVTILQRRAPVCLTADLADGEVSNMSLLELAS